MRILLTGAAGYIGLHILRELLENEHPVTVVARSPAKLGPFARHPLIRIVETDLEDDSRIVKALSGHDVCIHAALIWGDPGSELEARDTAVAAKLFTAAGGAGLTRCIYISSVAVHRPFSGEMCEESGLNATDFYGATKAAGELFLRAACAGHPMTGVVIRPGPVVGPPAFSGGSFRSPGRIAEIVGDAAAGRPIAVVRGEGRQFSDVSTLAQVVRLLTQMENPEPTYICVDRDIIPWEWIARLATASLNSPSTVRVVEPATQDLMPFFRTERMERLIGRPADAKDALASHVRLIAQAIGERR